MTALPQEFLRWNYLPRVKMFKDIYSQIPMQDMNRFFLESVRHNPALCTAHQTNKESICINAKIVGVGYVVKEKHLEKAVEAFSDHVRNGDKLFENVKTQTENENAANEYQKRAASLFLEYLYFEDLEKAQDHVDFSKMATIELALSKEDSSKHTWKIVQQNLNACLLFYQPPSISFEVRGKIEIHERNLYHKFVNLIHDSFHYVPVERRETRRPVYVFNVEEVFNNSATSEGFGRRIA